ncbi:hypothetical protein, partial [Bradyrhizobium sp. SZCCHNG3015]|uniref:hypothetical protein n=1 Tax=Bradyrhizobium sp. SZCCHNG3015 TaxID=3057270 RepID=UPI0028EBB8E3
EKVGKDFFQTSTFTSIDAIEQRLAAICEMQRILKAEKLTNSPFLEPYLDEQPGSTGRPAH